MQVHLASDPVDLRRAAGIGDAHRRVAFAGFRQRRLDVAQAAQALAAQVIADREHGQDDKEPAQRQGAKEQDLGLVKQVQPFTHHQHISPKRGGNIDVIPGDSTGRSGGMIKRADLHPLARRAGQDVTGNESALRPEQCRRMMPARGDARQGVDGFCNLGVALACVFGGNYFPALAHVLAQFGRQALVDIGERHPAKEQ